MEAVRFLIPLILLACTDRPATNDAGGESLRIVVVTHGQASDPFWSVVANGVKQAGADLRVRTSYQAPTRFDMVEMSNLIDAVVASRPNGLVVSIPDAAALGGALQRAVAAGIPVISINSGADVYSRFGILAHVGQTEYAAGLAAGDRMANAGVRRALCINHEVGNAGLDERCRGFGDGLARAQGTMRVLSVELANPDDAQQRIANALRADPQIDGMLTLGTTGAEPAMAALDGEKNAQVRLAGFDLSPRVLEAVRDGKMLFAIDQQQYLQGYLPIVLLKTYSQTMTLPGGGKVIETGPGFVTATNASRVLDLSARGLR